MDKNMTLPTIWPVSAAHISWPVHLVCFIGGGLVLLAGLAVVAYEAATSKD